MILTIGTALQHGRYIIEAVLHHDETGVSYRAQDQHLDQLVLLQMPLSPSEKEAATLTAQGQGVIAAARHRSKLPAVEARVMDCFIEQALPYVVIPYSPEMVLPSMTLWHPPDSIKPVEKTPPLEEVAPQAAAMATPSQPADVPAANSQEPVPTASLASQLHSNGTGPSSQKPSKKTPTTQVFVSEAPPKRRRWMPLALVLTAAVGGGAGAVFGWQVRQGKSISEVVPVVGSQLNTDQDFPPLEGWPVQEDEPLPEAGQERGSLIQDDTSLPPVSPETGFSRQRQEPLQTEPYGFDYGYEPLSPEDYDAPLAGQEDPAAPTARSGAPLDGGDVRGNAPAAMDEPFDGTMPGAEEVSPVPDGSLTPTDKLELAPPPPPADPSLGDRSSSSAPRPSSASSLPPLSSFPRDAIVPQ